MKKISRPKIGDKMPDGTIYGGISPDTNKPMYVAAEDTPRRLDFNKAAKYAKNVKAHGHKDWRVPTVQELLVLYQNREKGALKGTFNSIGSFPNAWYWSCTRDGAYDAWGKPFRDRNEFSDNNPETCDRTYVLSVRCVRG